MNTEPDRERTEGIDLSGALKSASDAAASSRASSRAARYYREPENPRIIRWVLRYSGGLVNNEQQAQYVLLGFVAIAVGISVILFFRALPLGGGDTGKLSPPPENAPAQYQP